MGLGFRYMEQLERKENNMLSITKTTNLSGTSVINGQSAMTMYAAVPETGSLTISQTITNKEFTLQIRHNVIMIMRISRQKLISC